VPDVAIRAERLSKLYRLGDTRSWSLSEALAHRLHRDKGRKAPVTHWAVRDVSFEVRPGETVGFIGRNGAGKSTMLKILSRITLPTSGRARLHGRVGSLLEVGTGFHYELSGAENIYLNGALLGLSRAEIKKRYDAIVEFSEIADFLDTPVKRYSSGMVVRLAFAVAAHLEPEILLVDEVLAVGDLAFQRKCLGKISETAAQGRTVLFVSHNMAVIQSLCTRGIFLSHGVVKADGPIDTAVLAYLREMEERAEDPSLSARNDRRGLQEIQVKRISIRSPSDSLQTLTSGRSAQFTFELSGVQRGLSCSFTIFDQLGNPVTTVTSESPAPDDAWEAQDEPYFECLIPSLLLVPGKYRLDFTLRGGGHVQDEIEGAAYFDVVEGVVNGRPVATQGAIGNVALPVQWRGPEIAGS
jgi:lipopolysaccharide transport system ATP-binding protein